jgi:uncharacterized protein
MNNGLLYRRRKLLTCYISNLSDMETKECEVKCLLARMKNLKMKRGIIITSDIFDEEVVDGKRIRYVPLWYGLLEGDHTNIS